MNNISNNVSFHASNRVMERTSCSRNKMGDYINRVWQTGKTIEAYKDRIALYKYLTNVKNNGGEDRNLRVSGNCLYIFNKSGSLLITCFDIPQKVIQDKRNKKHVR